VAMMQWEPVIGLEIHTQLATESKIFSGAVDRLRRRAQHPGLRRRPGPARRAAGAEPGRRAAGGALRPRHRRRDRPRSIFARKNYFYPDLPKGYQISQYELPVVGKGQVEIVLDDGSVKTVGVTRAHLEEDAGKSLHEDFHGMTGIDLNRAGTPLLEIVSEPDMRSPEEAVAYARKIHQLVRWIGISDGNMQEGSFRVDANISLRPKGQRSFGTRAEIKNINSFKFLQKAIEFEIERQADILDDGGTIVQETRLYDANKDETRSMRSKEEANDYRYFPDPDLLPLEIDEAFIDAATADLPELPDAMRHRFGEQYGLTDYDAALLTASLAMAATSRPSPAAAATPSSPPTGSTARWPRR
jgi:aspartyl-tRNA(Asn)/glutamyl-tRNA(Gln) amidotransferase subunit B